MVDRTSRDRNRLTVDRQSNWVAYCMRFYAGDPLGPQSTSGSVGISARRLNSIWKRHKSNANRFCRVESVGVIGMIS